MRNLTSSEVQIVNGGDGDLLYPIGLLIVSFGTALGCCAIAQTLGIALSTWLVAGICFGGIFILGYA